MKNISTVEKVVIYALLVIISVIVLIPLAYTFSASFKTNQEILAGGINLIPRQFTLEGYKEVWNMAGKTLKDKVTFADYAWNSIKICTLTTILSVVSTSMASYCFSRGNFPGRKFLYGFFLATMFIAAGSITMYPQLQITSKLGMNNWWGVAIIESVGASASNLFLTLGYLRTIPKEMDESAKIDGCTFFGTYWRIIMPLSIPILGTLALLKFKGSWNSFLMPRLMLASDPTEMTLVVAVYNLAKGKGTATAYNIMMAGSVLSILPIMIVFVLMNRTFIEGITQGAVKG